MPTMYGDSRVTVFAGAAERDKFRSSAIAALVLAGCPDVSPAREVVDRATGCTRPLGRPGNVSRRDMDIARVLLADAGLTPNQIDGIPAVDRARLMFGDHNVARRYGLSAAVVGNVSGMYQNLLYDAANVALRIGYEEVSPTFTAWATRLDDVTNYRPTQLVGVGAFPDPTAIGEDGELDEVSTVDERETIKVFEFGSKITISFILAANDQLGGLVTKAARKFGQAMRRKQNRLVYGVLKDNRALADGITLFDDASHGNLTSGAVSNYGSAFNAMMQKMAAQTAPGAGSSPLGIKPAFCLYPPAIDQSIKELLRSTSPPEALNSGVTNVHRGIVEPIPDAELSAAFGGSDTAFYLAASSTQIETVGYAFLESQGDQPVITESAIPGSLNRVMTCHQAFGVKAVSHRGLQKHVGA